MDKITNNSTVREIGLALLVLIATWGGLPTPPEYFKKLSRDIPFFRDFFRFLLYFVLLYVVNGNRDLIRTAIIATAVYLVGELVKYLEMTFN